MKKLNSAVALAALAAVMSTPVYAADVEPMPAAVDWTGFHVGLGGGGNFAFAEDEASAFVNDNDINNSFFSSAESFSDLGKAGVFGTAEIGADYQMDSIVFGVLANYDFGKTKMSTRSESFVNDNGNIANGNFESSVEVGDSWAVGGRLGMLATDSTLFYVLGGYTQAKVALSAELSSNNGANSLGDSQSGWESGYFVGAGAETLLTESISLKAEYRFSDYGKVESDYDFSNVNTNFSEGVSHSADVTVHSVRAVLSFRF